MVFGTFLFILISFIFLFIILDATFLYSLYNFSSSVQLSKKTKPSWFFDAFFFILPFALLLFILFFSLGSILTFSSPKNCFLSISLFLHHNIFTLIATINFFLLLFSSLFILHKYCVIYILKYNSLEKKYKQLTQILSDCTYELLAFQNNPESSEYIELSALSKSYSEQLDKINFEQLKLKLHIKEILT